MDDHAESTAIEAVDPEPALPDLDGYACYEDGDHFVVCDRENPNAWVRSDLTADLDV